VYKLDIWPFESYKEDIVVTNYSLRNGSSSTKVAWIWQRVWNSTSILNILKFNFIIFKRRLELVRLGLFYYPTIVMVTHILTKSLPYLKLGFCKENIGVSDIALTITIDKSSKKCSKRLGVMFCLISTASHLEFHFPITLCWEYHFLLK
jgi:hypothetical protein